MSLNPYMMKGYKQEESKRKSHLKITYGITPEDYDKMYQSQDGKCAICDLVTAKFYIDHSHESHRIRGLLCLNCNWGLGHFRDSAKLLTKAIKYLKDK